MTASLTGAWLALVILQALAWAGAAVLGAGVGKLGGRLRTMLVLALASVGLGAAIGAALVAVAMSGAAWSFAAEKLLIAAPVGIVSSAAGLGFLVWDGSRRRAGAAPANARIGVAIAAALGAAVAPTAMLLVGATVTPFAALALIGTWLAASAAAVLISLRRPLRTVVPTGVFAVLCAALLALFTVFGPSISASAAAHHLTESPGDTAETVSIESLRSDATGEPDERFQLEARHELVTLPDGSSFDAVDFGSVPGPSLVVTQGDLVEVVLTNRDVEEGVTLHWHGVDVPGGDDGVAGVTQDVVRPGESFTYRFVAEDAGTYWYHTHQNALDLIRRGLYGSFVVLPADQPVDAAEATALIHTLGSTMLVGEAPVLQTQGGDQRLRIANTDQVPRRLVLDGDATVLAIDGTDLGTPVPASAGTVLRIPAGGRLDLAPGDATSLAVEGGRGAGVTFGGADAVAALSFTGPEFDVLQAANAAMPSWAEGPYDVHGTQVLDKLIRVVDGIPRVADTINGAAFPFIEPIVVAEGDVVEVTIINRGTETHPMHLHGHHAVVLSRNGVEASGALWLDSIDVRPGDVWRVAFLADNPGLWMDHCHNLEHARDGMVMHLAYEGVTTPFELGGAHGNDPE